MKPAPTAAVTTPLPALPKGWHAVAYAILSDGCLAIIGADTDLQRLSEDQHVFKTAMQTSARIWVFDGSEVQAGPEFLLETPCPVFDRFPDGRWLIASARAWDDQNVRIVSPEGREMQRLRLGDGIMQLKIDDASSIWAGWFDEGVFGNDGWRLPGLEWPPSAYGLAAFNDRGSVIRTAAGAPSGSEIADCYALNIAGVEAWACTYPDFPISRSQADGPSLWWSTKLAGPRAVAVSFPHILAAGGYGDDGDRLSLGKIDNDNFALLDEWGLPFRVGFPDAVDFVDGRGDQLHIINDGVWHIWKMEQFVPS